MKKSRKVGKSTAQAVISALVKYQSVQILTRGRILGLDTQRELTRVDVILTKALNPHDVAPNSN